ncbi:quinon protein alcohol dehydrogenase-like superfamily [Trichoderma ceciliae]
MANIRQISGSTVGNNSAIIQGDFNATFNTNPSDADSSFLEKISQTDPVYDKKRILELKGPFLHESFRWILDHEDFNRWRCTKESGVLWIKGDPGKGKTMLLCGIIDDLEKNPGIIAKLGYFFCQATDSRINNAAAVIGGLTFSLLKQHTALLSPVRQKYEDKMSQLSGPNAWHILCDIFETVAQDPTLPDPVCVVDALDECEHECKSLLSLIVKTSYRVKWLLSSRNVKDIERGLRLIEPPRRLSLELKENAEYVSKSVDVYINCSIQDIEALEGDEELQIKTTNVLKSKANGTFLWVALVIEQLCDSDHRNVEDVLEEIPEGLENLYALIMKRSTQRLGWRDREVCQILLSIVTIAERPLHLEELLVFMKSQCEHFKATYGLRDVRDMVKDCGSFLSIRDDTVYFIHQSAKDYMVNNAATSIFPSGIGYQHYKMLVSSLYAMSRTLKHNIYDLKAPGIHVDNIAPPDPDPLTAIAYCCIFWVEHLFRSYQSERSDSEGLLKDDGILHSFLKDKYLCWLESLAILRSLIPQGVDAVYKLKNLIAVYYRSKGNGHQVGAESNPQRGEDTNCLRALTTDAHQFFQYCKDYVRYWPLQLYYSAVVFENEHGAIYKTFQQRIRADFADSPTFLNMPRRRLSLLQTIRPNGSGLTNSLVYSTDSSLLCSLSFDGIISLWRTNTGILERVIDMNLNGTNEKALPANGLNYHVSFSSDSRHLLSTSSTGIVQVWTVDNGTQTQRYSLNLDKRLCQNSGLMESYEILREEVISLSRTGDLAASACRDSSGRVSLVRVWATKVANCMYDIDQSHTPKILHAVFSPNSALLALIDEAGVRIHSTQTGEEVQHLQNPPIESSFPDWRRLKIRSKFSPDSNLFAFLHNSHDIYLWCTESWTMMRHIGKDMDFPQETILYHFDFSPDSALFAAASYHYLFLGSVETGRCLLTIETRAEAVTFSPDWTNSSLLAYIFSNTVQIWRADTSDILAEMQNAPDTSGPVVISPNSRLVAALDLEKTNIKIWSGDGGKCVQVLQRGKCVQVPIRGKPIIRPDLVFSPDLELLAGEDGNEGDVRIWHVSTGKSIHLLEGLGGDCYGVHVAFSDDSKYLLAGYSNGKTRVYCVESGKCLYDNNCQMGFISSVGISPDSKYVALGFLAKVQIWDWSAGYCVSSFGPTQRSRGLRIESLTFSSDSTVLAVIRADYAEYEVEIWGVATGACLAFVPVGYSYCRVSFDPSEGHILTGDFIWYKKSTWEDWDQVQRPGYTLLHGQLETWICFDGEKVFWVPREFCPGQWLGSFEISDCLLAYTDSLFRINIIKVPRQHHLQR